MKPCALMDGYNHHIRLLTSLKVTVSLSPYTPWGRVDEQNNSSTNA